MKNLFVLAAALAAATSISPMPSKAQVILDTPLGGVRIGDSPREERREERREELREERDASGTRNCRTVTVQESGPGGTVSRTRQQCD